MENRKYSLDFLKIAAIIFIFFHHYQQYIGGIFEGGLNFYGGRFNFGLMVELFFILSGFFVWPYVKKIHDGLTLKKFFLHKAKRLVPMLAICAVGYEIVIVLYYVAFGHLEPFFDTTSLWEFFLSCTGLQKGWVFEGTPTINYPVWYISILLLCYLFFWIGTYICRKLHTSARYFFVLMIMWGVAINSYDINTAFMSHYNARGYISFFTGVLLASYLYDAKINTKSALTALLVVVFLGILYFVKPVCFEYRFEYILGFVFYPALIILFLTDTAGKIFSHKFWKEAADVAFHAFMWHYVGLILMFTFMALCPGALERNSYTAMIIFAVLAFLMGLVSKVLTRPLFGKGKSVEKGN